MQSWKEMRDNQLSALDTNEAEIIVAVFEQIDKWVVLRIAEIIPEFEKDSIIWIKSNFTDNDALRRMNSLVGQLDLLRELKGEVECLK